MELQISLRLYRELTFLSPSWRGRRKRERRVAVSNPFLREAEGAALSVTSWSWDVYLSCRYVETLWYGTVTTSGELIRFQ
ncbi:hypothetical protein E2C01_084734 [Portunus trituberculatus]|uniref:Uncharacterized protein n=1 Tax=Portunus trituberculatus TaxID=210409 RepID=A0A5B7JBP8_PORTR|nr:hypothetical protein [Portunus trituberculatus]